MNIDKLEKLGCLSLPDDVKSTMQDSIESVMDMMRCIEQITPSELVSDNNIDISNLVQDQIQADDCISKTDTVVGIHLEDEYFLAPKTIRK